MVGKNFKLVTNQEGIIEDIDKRNRNTQSMQSRNVGVRKHVTERMATDTIYIMEER